jgi:alpha/beta superfamily hydrolase
MNPSVTQPTIERPVRGALGKLAALALAAAASCLRLDGATAAPIIDYEREARWEQEVIPAIVVGDAIHLATATRPRVLAIVTAPTGSAKGAVIVLHGLGVHPDWGLIGALRARLADDGYLTLSVQMPVLAADVSRDDYGVTLPEAGERIAAAIRYLSARGLAKIAIVSHSYGATMANAYLARPGHAAIAAWIPMGMFGSFEAPPKQPILDIVAERELPQVRASAPLRSGALPRDACSRALTIPRADHYFETARSELAAAIAAFLDDVFAGRC